MKVKAPEPAAPIPAIPAAATAPTATPVKTLDGKTPLLHRREVRELIAYRLLPPLVGIGLFLLLWMMIAQTSPQLPTPAKTWHSATELFAHPFYDNGPNDKGIGWNILNSLQRVGIGFGLAALIGIPLGFMIGRFLFLSRMIEPVISVLRPVSPPHTLP